MDRHKRINAGFTLIEVMIVMVIIAILLLVAVPGYQESMRKSHRADGMRDLMELASRQERFYAQHSRYTDNIESETGLNYKRTVSSEGHYELSVEKCAGKADGDFSTCYVLNAAPKTDDLKKNDKCGTLRVDSKGQRTVSGPADSKCW